MWCYTEHTREFSLEFSKTSTFASIYRKPKSSSIVVLQLWSRDLCRTIHWRYTWLYNTLTTIPYSIICKTLHVDGINLACSGHCIELWLWVVITKDREVQKTLCLLSKHGNKIQTWDHHPSSFSKQKWMHSLCSIDWTASFTARALKVKLTDLTFISKAFPGKTIVSFCQYLKSDSVCNYLI